MTRHSLHFTSLHFTSLIERAAGTAVLAILASLLTVSMPAQQPATPRPPLLNSRTMTLKGKIRAALPAAGPQTIVPAGPIPEACGFELMLKPGERSIEARMLGPVRKNNDHECEADFEVGIPTKIYPPPQANGAAETTATVNNSTKLPPDIVIGQSDGHAPDLTPVFDSARNLQPDLVSPDNARPYYAITGNQQFSSGYIAGIVLDPLNLQVTYENEYVGWLWTQPGTCVQASGFSRYVTDYWPTGWFVNYDQPTQYANCNGTVNYSYTVFVNTAFCFVVLGSYVPTWVYYWPMQIQGWQDGTLYGNFAWIIFGSPCANWLTPTYQLNRLVN